MSGAEAAGLVLGIISSIIAIIDVTVKVYDAATDASGLPEAFRDVVKRLSLARDTLKAVQRYLVNFLKDIPIHILAGNVRIELTGTNEYIPLSTIST